MKAIIQYNSGWATSPTMDYIVEEWEPETYVKPLAYTQTSQFFM